MNSSQKNNFRLEQIKLDLIHFSVGFIVSRQRWANGRATRLAFIALARENAKRFFGV